MHSLRLFAISSLLVTAVSVTTGCGGSSPGPATEYWDRLLDASCSVGVRCGEYESVDSCHALLDRIRKLLSGEIASEDAAIAGGSLIYDADAADACFALAQTRACDTSSRAHTACDDVFKGARKTGEACAFREECVSGRCDVPSCSMACCTGTCAAAPTPAAIGQSCATLPCADGAFCDSTMTCHALLAAGAACTSILDCDYDLYCGDSTHTCLKAASLGQACNPADTLLGCAQGRCDTTTQKCVPYVFAGAACDPDNSLCALPLTCDKTTSKCTAGAALGQPCTPGCAAGFCKKDPATGADTCVALLGTGEACSSDKECDSGTCGSTSQKCVDPVVCW